MGTNILRIQPQALEADLGGMEVEEGDNVSFGDVFMKSTIGEKIGADGGVKVGLVWEKVEEAPSRDGYVVTMGEVSIFHGGELAPDATLLCV